MCGSPAAAWEEKQAKSQTERLHFWLHPERAVACST